MMSTEMERKQSTQSVIAKLMGLDEPPLQQPVQKKPRVLSETYLRRVASIGVREKRSRCNSFRLSSEEQKDYIDAFQILDTLKRHKHCIVSVEKRKARLSSSEVKTMVGRKEFKQAKHVSEDVKLQCLKEFHDVPNDIGLNAGTSPKIFFKPEFTEKPNDLQAIPHCSQSGHITVLKPLHPSDSRDLGKCRKSWGISEKGHVKSTEKVKDGLGTYSCRTLGLDDRNKFLGSRLDFNDGSCHPTTRIIVLKPNSGKLENSERWFSSTGSCKVFCSNDRGDEEIPNTQNGNLHVEMKERKNLANGSGPASPMSRFSKEMSRKMKHCISNMSSEAKRAEYTGSQTIAREFESVICSLPLDTNSQFHHTDGSYLAMEAKKHISERWKTTKEFQQVELACSSKTLGEMFVIPDHGLGSIKSDYKPGKRGLNNQARAGCGAMNRTSPLGISNCGGWKDEYAKDFPRSRSVVSSSTVASPKNMTRHKSLQNGSYMKGTGSINWVQKHPVVLDSNQKDGLECRNADASQKKKDHAAEANDASQNELKEEDPRGQNSAAFGSSGTANQSLKYTCGTQMRHSDEGMERDVSEQNSAVHRSSICSTSSNTISPSADTLVDAELCHEMQQLESGNSILSAKDEDLSSHVLDVSIQQEISNRISEEEVSASSKGSGTDPDPESLMSLEETYQTSPDSVLEPLFKKEISSSSDCFETIGASLYGFHTQLELLKSDTSETCSEGSDMIVSSDEDVGEVSVDDSEQSEDQMKLFRAEDSRDFSYLVDVLSEAGFNSRNLHIGFDTWLSQGRHISFSVFETLEKKYGEQVSWKRSERRLLFDCINLGLIEILQPSMGVATWSKPVARRFCFGLGQEEIDEELWMLLAAQEKNSGKDSEKVLGKDDRWLELSDDIQIIGSEIENSLMDELVADVVSMESF